MYLIIFNILSALACLRLPGEAGRQASLREIFVNSADLSLTSIHPFKMR